MTPNRKNIHVFIKGMEDGHPVAVAVESTRNLKVTCSDTPNATENKRRAEQRLLKEAEEYEYKLRLQLMNDMFERFPMRVLPHRFKPQLNKNKKKSKDTRMRRR